MGPPKPSGEPFLEICKRLDVRPEEAVMVGDSAARDIGTGLAAGAGSAIGVTSGTSSAEKLWAGGAHDVIPTVANILAAVGKRHTVRTGGSGCVCSAAQFAGTQE